MYIMHNDLVGIYWLLNVLPLWATALIMYSLTMVPLFILRDKCEGLYYNTSYSAVIGDGGLIGIVLMAANILHEARSYELAYFMHGYSPLYGQLTQDGQLYAGIAAILFGLMWFALDRPKQWADRYHHLVIAPVLLFLGITLVPLVLKSGDRFEGLAMFYLIAIWAVLVVYDWRTGRLNQRRYLGLGGYLDAIKRIKYPQKPQVPPARPTPIVFFREESHGEDHAVPLRARD